MSRDAGQNSWGALIAHARTWRIETRKATSVPFSRLSLFQRADGNIAVVGLGTPTGSPAQTLVTADVPISLLTQSPSDRPHVQTLHLRGLVNLEDIKTPPSKDFVLLCERQRAPVTAGVTDYQLSSDGNIAFLSMADRCLRLDLSTLKVQPVSASSVLGAQMRQDDPSHVAYVHDQQLYVWRDGTVVYNTSEPSGSCITNGQASFVAQEELDRFTGFWWSPTGRRIVYEHVNERDVEELMFAAPGQPLASSSSSQHSMRYPLAGRANAICELRLLDLEQSNPAPILLRRPLTDLLPWCEYVARVGWLPDGKNLWLFVLSRSQDKGALVLLPFAAWAHPFASKDIATVDSPRVIYEEHQPDGWVNKHNLTCALSRLPTGAVAAFLHASEKFDHCHLLHIVVMADGRVVERRITQGDWSILKGVQLCVDETNQLAFFLANFHHPTEQNLCVTTYGDQPKFGALTPSGLSVRAERSDVHPLVNTSLGMCALWMSSLYNTPVCNLYRIRHLIPGQLPKLQLLAALQLNEPHVYRAPGNTTHRLVDVPLNRTNQSVSALVLLPTGRQGPFPVLHYVYGGPEVQIVKNLWSTWVQFAKWTEQGFAVVLADVTGSSNRGLTFEKLIRGQLGAFEVDDQVEVLKKVAAHCPDLDMTRVAIHGWSYGGFMTLHAMARHAELYRAGIAGGAVTDWTLYDTCYTERYMGYPVDSATYAQAGIPRLVSQLPDEPGRLLLVHGLLDENVHFKHVTTLIEALIRAGKPYELQLFPSERHGIRATEAAEHLDATMLAFLKRSLST